MSAAEGTGSVSNRLACHLSGQGSATLVLSPGFGTDQSVWRHLRPVLEPRFTVLTHDLACVADPDFRVETHASLAGYADDLIELLVERRLEDVVFVGHSVSAMIGVLASIEQPRLFRRLILLNASPRYRDAPGYHGGFTSDDLERLFATMARNYAAWIAGFAPAAVGADAPEAVREFSAGLARMRPDIAISVARTIFESDVRAVLPAVRHPVHLLHTRDDLAVPMAVATYLHECLPDSRLDFIDAHGHLPHLSAPTVVGAALDSALAEVS